MTNKQNEKEGGWAKLQQGIGHCTGGYDLVLECQIENSFRNSCFIESSKMYSIAFIDRCLRSSLESPKLLAAMWYSLDKVVQNTPLSSVCEIGINKSINFTHDIPQ